MVYVSGVDKSKKAKASGNKSVLGVENGLSALSLSANTTDKPKLSDVPEVICI